VIHDTSPTLYVKTAGKGRRAVKIVKDALFSVFVSDGKFLDSNLPAKVVIADELPYTHTGKVDVHQIQRNHYPGEQFYVEPVRRQGRLADIKLMEYAENSLIRRGGVPEELERVADMVLNGGGFTGRMPKLPGIFKKGSAAAPMEMPMQGGPDLNMLCELVKSGTIEPEMLGHMLARMIIEQEEEKKKRKKKHKKSRKESFRGC
jgi:hypothetical protein